MSRGNWNRIKHSKFFYVQIYRKVITAIVASQVINVILCLGVIYFYFNQPVRTFYATSGITPPIELTPLGSPNFSAEALLPPDPVDEDVNRVIPD